MRNLFFQTALKKSATLAGKHSRILLLTVQLGKYLNKVDWRTIKDFSIKEKVNTLGRFVKAYAVGNYRAVSIKSLLVILASIIYFIDPIDLIPDLMPFIGFTDDMGILLWVYNSLESEVNKFLTWEKTTRA